MPQDAFRTMSAIITATTRYHWLLLILCIILFLGFTLPSVQDLLIEDEVAFVRAAEAIVKTGVPEFYHGELRPQFYGLWHPPLFIYTLASGIVIFGVSEVGARAVTLLFALGTIILIYFISLQIFNREKSRYAIAILAVFLYVINPFVIQSALLIDIDNSILTFLFTLFIYVFVRSETYGASHISNNLYHQPIRYLIILSVLFAIILWSKFGTAPVLILAIFCYLAFNKQYRKALYYVGGIVACGILIFLSTWLLYCAVFTIPILAPFKHSPGYLLNFGFRSSELSYILYVLVGRLKIITFWMTPFLAILIGLFIVSRTRNYLKTRGSLSLVDLLLILSILIFIEYTLIMGIGYFFPKYYAPMMPFLTVLLADIIINRADWHKPTRQNLIFYVVAFIVIIAYCIFILDDPYISRDSIPQTFIATIKFIILFGLGLALFTAVYKIHWKKLLISTLIVLLIPTCIYLNCIQLVADYSTRYNYGEAGMENTIAYIKSHTTQNDIIIAPNDIGYYVELAYYEDCVFRLYNITELDNIIQKHNITFIVLREHGAYGTALMPTTIKKYIDANFNLTATYNEFKIFKRK